jgi:ribosomal protein S12 methylthiotransferase accessory factor
MANDLAFRINARINSGGEVTIPLKTLRTEALRLRLFEAVIHNCPAHFFIAFAVNPPDDPEWLWGWRAAAGRGLDQKSARQAAVWEAIERASAMTGGVDDPRGEYHEDPPEGSVDPQALWQYSADQLLNLCANEKYNSLLNCGKGVDNLWLNGVHLWRGTRQRLPATAVLLDEDRRLGLGSAFTTSTGTAARGEMESATRHAVMERVERDAVAIWWYNRLPAPRLEADRLLPPPLASWLRERRRTTWHLVMPHDLPAPTIVAISARADGTRPAIGAAAALDPAKATLSATLEMLQGEIALSQMRAADHDGDPPPLLQWSDTANAFAEPELRGEGAQDPPKPITYETLVAAMEACGIDVYIADLTRPELGVPVVRAVSPQLRDWLPRFGPGRLYDVPVALGLRPEPTPETALNPVPFVI